MTIKIDEIPEDEYNFLENCLPFDIARTQQIEALKTIKDSKKRFIILEMPTGSGKSGVAFGTSNLGENAFLGIDTEENNYSSTAGDGYKSYILTSQKILQKQYLNDFNHKPGFSNLEGAGNYICPIEKGKKCNTASCKDNMFLKKDCFIKGCCPYIEAVKKFNENPISLTNYAWFQSSVINSSPEKQMPVRDFLLLDEAHNIVDSTTGFFTLEIDLNEFEEIFDKKIDHKNIERVKEEIKKASLILTSLESQFKLDLEEEKKKGKQKPSEYLKRKPSKYSSGKENSNNKGEGFNFDGIKSGDIARKIMLCKKMRKEFNKFILFQDEEWLLDKVEDKVGIVIKIILKPVTVSGMLEETIFKYGRKIIFLSATLGGKKDFCNSIGLDDGKADYLSLDSTFPEENRTLTGVGTAKMGYKDIKEALPKILKAVEGIMEEHHGEKGIIHTQNFQIMNYIKDNIGIDNEERLIFNDSGGAKEALEIHEFGGIHNSVLCTPSMSEGVDLKDNLSRFQIIVKVPFPFIGDPLIKRRNEINPRYIEYQMIKKIMQMSGRSIRHEKDKCETYVLDSSFKYWMDKNKNNIPKYFLDAIR